MYHFSRIINILFVTVVILGCREQEANLQSSASDGGNLGNIEVNFLVENLEPNRLALTSDGFKIDAVVEGCISGYSVKISEKDGDRFKVVEGDRNCQFRVNSFTHIGETFLFDSAADWSKGSVITAVGSQSTVLSFKIISQLDLVIEGPQAITIVYNSVERGDSYTIESHKFNGGINISGSSPINMEIVDHILRLEGKSDRSVVSLVLGCSEKMGDEKHGYLCGTVDVSKLIGGSVPDTFTQLLTLEECLQIADGKSGNLKSHPFEADKHPLALNGGAEFNNVLQISPKHGNEDRKIIFALANKKSTDTCKYFKISF